MRNESRTGTLLYGGPSVCCCESFESRLAPLFFLFDKHLHCCLLPLDLWGKHNPYSINALVVPRLFTRPSSHTLTFVFPFRKLPRISIIPLNHGQGGAASFRAKESWGAVKFYEIVYNLARAIYQADLRRGGV